MVRWSGVLVVTLAGISCTSGAEPEGDPIGVVSQAWTAEACGTVLATYDGTAAKSNGVNTGTGVSCVGSGTYGLQYQCVELVMRHFKTHWNLRWYGNAKDLLAHAKSSSFFASGSPADVEVWDNGDAAHPPKAGDMIVWTSGTYGHVALITGVTATTVAIIEQNVSGVTPQGKYTLTYNGKTVAGRWGGLGPAGWVHAKKNVSGVVDAGAPDSAKPDTALKDSGLTDTESADSALEDTAVDPDAAIDTAEPEGVGDPIVAPSNDVTEAEDTVVEGSCTYGASSATSGLVMFAIAGFLFARRRR